MDAPLVSGWLFFRINIPNFSLSEILTVQGIMSIDVAPFVLL